MYKDLDFLNIHSSKSIQARPIAPSSWMAGLSISTASRTIYIPMLDVNRTVQEAMHYLMRAPLPQGKTQKALPEPDSLFRVRVPRLQAGQPHATFAEFGGYGNFQSVRSRGGPSEKERQKLHATTANLPRRPRVLRILDGRSRGLLLEWSPLLTLDRRCAFSLSEQIGRTIGDHLYENVRRGSPVGSGTQNVHLSAAKPAGTGLACHSSGRSRRCLTPGGSPRARPPCWSGFLSLSPRSRAGTAAATAACPGESRKILMRSGLARSCFSRPKCPPSCPISSDS